MKEVRPVISDDRIFRETGERVDAHETHTISLDGVAAELDTTTENGKRLLEDMRPWLEAGHEPGTSGAPGTSGQKVKMPGQRAPSTEAPSTRALHRDMRKYGDANGMGEGVGYHKKPEGKNGYTYEPILRAAFQAHLRERGHPWADHKTFDTSRGGSRASGT